MTRRIAVLLTLFVALALSRAKAQQPNAAPPAALQTGPHGGKIHQVGDFRCEAVFSSKAIEVFVFNRDGKPIVTQKVRGQISVAVQGNPRTYRYDLYPQSGNDEAANALGVGIDLSRVADRTATVDFALYGIAQQPVSFATEFQRSLTPEQVAISQQRICPVSGKPLGSMGNPPRVRIGNQDVYVCCAGCTKALKANPQVHLAKLTEPALIKAKPADAPAITQQKICPVTGEPLNSMGGPWKISVKGRELFVCCKGCIKEVKEHPDKVLRRVAQLSVNNRVVR
jgi:YHS domain-containing protein